MGSRSPRETKLMESLRDNSHIPPSAFCRSRDVPAHNLQRFRLSPGEMQSVVSFGCRFRFRKLRLFLGSRLAEEFESVVHGYSNLMISLPSISTLILPLTSSQRR